MKISKNVRFLMNDMLAALVLVAFVSCNVNFKPSFKESITDSAMRSRVSKVIDAQLENVREYLDDDLREQLDGVSQGKGTGLSSEEIIDLTLKEASGRDYLDFCYAVDLSSSTGSVDDVMDTARCILTDEAYKDLCQRAGEIEKGISLAGEEMAKGIPLNQQAAFYKDLKILVTRAIVLLVAGVVYACMPNVVFWGKVSAACAVSVGAGLVAISIMSLYEYYSFGQEENVSFETWFKDLMAIPKADFALTTGVTAIAEAMGAGPVVTGIIICVFGVYNVVGLVRTMMETYNLDA